MRFLVDANLPRAAVTLLAECGHEAGHVRDLGLAPRLTNGLPPKREPPGRR